MTKRGFIISIVMIISLVLILSGLNHVAEGNGNGAPIRMLSFEQIGNLINAIPGPIIDFINSLNFRPDEFRESVQQVGDIVGNGSDLTIDKDTPSRIWGTADNWFVDLTGLHLADILRGIGKTIVWFLELALALFKWLLSLFEAP